jgi:hypothetical protein
LITTSVGAHKAFYRVQLVTDRSLIAFEHGLGQINNMRMCINPDKILIRNKLAALLDDKVVTTKKVRSLPMSMASDSLKPRRNLVNVSSGYVLPWQEVKNRLSDEDGVTMGFNPRF